MEQLYKENPSILANKQEALFEALLQATINTPRQRITPRGEDGPTPLSFAQQRLWFLDQLEPGNTAYNVFRAIRLMGQLDPTILEKCLNKIVCRHEILRTIFIAVEGQPAQVILPNLTISLPVIDLSNLPESEQEAQIQQHITQESQRVFDLKRGPLLQVTLLQLTGEEQILLLVAPHIIIDGWSINIFFRELSALYKAYSMGQPSPLAALPIQYADFAIWQRAWLQGEALGTQLTYWKQQLAGQPTVLNLPIDHLRPARQTFRGGHQSVVIARELTARLKELSHKEGVTLFMTLLAAFQAMLYRYTGQDDIVVGSPIAGRTRAEIEGLVGLFINTLVLRTNLSGNPTFQEILQRVRETALGAYKHQELPFEKLVEELRPARNLGLPPLFQVLFNMHNFADFGLVEMPGLTMEYLSPPELNAQFDLTLNAIERDEEIQLKLVYNIDLFEPSTIAQMLNHLVSLLKDMATKPDFLKERLPDYMASSAFVMLDSLPQTSNIKMNRQHLPKLDRAVQARQEAYMAPRDQLELQLTKIWENVLNIRPIGLRDDFFDLGGHSLLAVRLFTQLEKVFDRSLPLATLFHAPTIEQLSQVLRDEGCWRASWASLVPIQPQGSRPPFFCVHAVGGNVLSLRDLAYHLGTDQPFYALQSQGLDEGKKCPGRIEEMAAYYIDEIRTVQPEGPYYLGGQSSGGLIVFEMAQQLRVQGEQVAVLALIDTFDPNYDKVSITMPFRHRISFHLAAVLQLGSAYVLEQINYRRKKLKIGVERIIVQAIGRIYGSLKRPMPQRIRYLYVREIIRQAIKSYTPQSYEGRITLFRATNTIQAYLEDLHGIQRRWDGLAVGGIETHDIAGAHNLEQEPYVGVLADKLKSCLNKA